MRELTLKEIREKVKEKGTAIDDAVNRFRLISKREGWLEKRPRPRDSDEIKALDLIARQAMIDAQRRGQVIYDKESRVLRIERLEKL